MISWRTRFPRAVPGPLVFVLAAVFSLFVALVMPATASASTTQVCGNGGTGYCINNWNGAGGVVKMYYGGTINDSFKIINLTGDCNGGYVSNGGATPLCPFVNPDLDQQYAGHQIVEVYSIQTGLCVGGGTGVLGACGASNGSGAATGAIMIEDRPLGCAYHETTLVDRYWSDFNSLQTYVSSGGNPGTGVNLDAASATCWGGSGVS